jgi:hypothetical protein
VRARLGTRGDANLNKLGAEGWELASVAPAGDSVGIYKYTLCAKRALP